jgi:hypothetical protein
VISRTSRLVQKSTSAVEPAANRHVRADDEHDVGKPALAPVVYFVQDAPCGEHRHHGRLARAGRHLAGVADEAGEPLGLLVVARLVAGHGDSLPEVGAGLGQKDDRLGRFELCEEQSLLAPIASPMFQQFMRRSRHAGPAGPPPRAQPLADQIHQR